MGGWHTFVSIYNQSIRSTAPERDSCAVFQLALQSRLACPVVTIKRIRQPIAAFLSALHTLVMVSSPRSKMMNNEDTTGMPELKSRTRAQAKQQSFNSESRAMKKKLDVTQPTAMPKAVWFVAFALIMGGLYLYHAFTTQGKA